MVIDAGRIKHLGDLMHKSIASNGTAVTSNWRLSADGLTNVVWSPDSAGGSVSYGSNSNEVTYANAPGASSLVARADHAHRGVTSVSHASNTYTGPVTLETEGALYIVRSAANTFRLGSTGGSGSGGSGTLSTVEEVDGSPTDSAVTKLVFPNGTLSITSHVATYTPTGGSSFTHSYIGRNTVGASFEALVASRQMMKKVTVASAGMLQNVGIHVKVPTTTDIVYLTAFVLTDAAGVPDLLIAQSTTHQLGFKNGNAARWYHMPVPIYLTAADYWVGVVVILNNTSSMQVAYDTGGSDPYFTVGQFALDGNYAARTDSTKNYSIRASILT